MVIRGLGAASRDSWPADRLRRRQQNLEIIFAESDQSYIKKLAAELLRCHDDLEGKISFVFDERHGTLRNAHGQPKPFDGEGLEAGLAATSPLYGPGPSWRKHPSSEEKEVRSRDMPRR